MRLNLFGFFGAKTNTKPTHQKDTNEFGIDITPVKHAGVTVNHKTASSIDTVYACIRDKAESIGQLPVCLYRKDGSKVEDGREHKIFTQQPNSFMTMQDLVENYVTCLETYGKWFAYTVRNKYGNVAEIIPFRYQQNVRVEMDDKGRIYFTYTTNDMKPNMTFSVDEIVHIKLNTLDGFTGISPIMNNARTFGIALSQEDHIDQLMQNDAAPRGVLETDTYFQDASRGQALLKEWNKIYGVGAKGKGKTALLEHGLKYKPVTLTPADVELIKQREYSKTQICAIFRVPGHRVGITAAMTYKNLEDNNRAYMRDSLVPIITKFENAMRPFLRGLTLELDTKGFVRGDRLSQVEAVGQEVKLGLISINEGRRDLGRQDAEGGDVHAIDTNNLTFGQLTDIPGLQAEARALTMSALNNDDSESETEVDDEDTE